MSEVVRFHHSMVDFVREHILAGLTGDDDIARILAEGYRKPVGREHVTLWKRQHPRFARVCENAVDNMNAIAVGVVAQAIKDGSTVDAWKWLERRNELFKPASKVDLTGRVEGLAEMLTRRTSEAQLEKDGVLIYDEE